MLLVLLGPTSLVKRIFKGTKNSLGFFQHWLGEITRKGKCYLAIAARNVKDLWRTPRWLQDLGRQCGLPSLHLDCWALPNLSGLIFGVEDV